MSVVNLAIPPSVAAANTAMTSAAAIIACGKPQLTAAPNEPHTATTPDKPRSATTPIEPRIVYDENGNAVNFDDLADIRFIKIDQSLPADEKYQEYLRQIKDPRLYRYDDIVIRADFSNSGATLTDRLKQYFYSARGLAI